MRVLVVGAGAREHALCSALARNPVVDRIYAAPGNAGMREYATLEHLSVGDIPGIAEFCERESIDLTVVGPEMPLVAGLADELLDRGLPVFGPTRDAAMIEGSKTWARELCLRHGIPGPLFGAFTDPSDALGFLDRLEAPYVVKADGLAAGKGVTIAETRAEAERAIEDCLVARVFGDAGARVVLEEHLTGIEVSAFAMTDGKTVLPLTMAQDYKRALDGDRGPNTGGMGAYSPLPFVDDALAQRIDADVLRATVAAMEEEGIRYQGVLYAGLMLTADGPKVLEFNARFGDPEDAGGRASAGVEPGRADARLRGGQPGSVPDHVEARGPGRRRDGVGRLPRAARERKAHLRAGRGGGAARRRGVPFGNGPP